jgi:hypothetical protein
MEWAANVLLEQFRMVLIRAAYDNYVRIRFRADDVKDKRLYFGKVPSQFRKWREKGGALITWKNNNREGEHDAIVFVECPKSLKELERASVNTKSVGVIYAPPTWRMHEQQIIKRHPHGSRKRARQLEKLSLMRYFVEHLPELTRPRLRSLCARLERARSWSSSSPGSPGGAARSSGNPG